MTTEEVRAAILALMEDEAFRAELYAGIRDEEAAA